MIRAAPPPLGAGKKGPPPGRTSEGLTWPLGPTVAMGTVPVLQEAGRAASCFEEGSRAVSLQSACPEGAGSLGPGHPGRWVCGGAMPTPGRPGGASWKCGLGRKPTGQQKGKKKNGWPEEGGHFLQRPWIPPSGDKNSEWPCPARTPLPPRSALPRGVRGLLDKGLRGPCCPPQLRASRTHQPHWAPGSPQFLLPPRAATLSCSCLLV